MSRYMLTKLFIIYLVISYLTNCKYLMKSSSVIYFSLIINKISPTKFCENASDYVYWYASTGRCNKTECKGYYEVGY